MPKRERSTYGRSISIDNLVVVVLKGGIVSSANDCFTYYPWRRLYITKLQVTAVHVLNEDVLPFFDQHRVTVTTFLAENKRANFGRSDKHPYENFRQYEETNIQNQDRLPPQSNGFADRLHKTLFD